MEYFFRQLKQLKLRPPGPEQLGTSGEEPNLDFIGTFCISWAHVMPFAPFVISRSAVRIRAPAFSPDLVAQGFPQFMTAARDAARWAM
jgi:hypothetical protein